MVCVVVMIHLLYCWPTVWGHGGSLLVYWDNEWSVPVYRVSASCV
jgi:hypothetical protein